MEKNQNNQKETQQIKQIDPELINSLISKHTSIIKSKPTDNLDELCALVDDYERLNRKIIFDSVQKDISPESVSFKKLNKRYSGMRVIGRKFLNLFRISFTVEFAGVVLINFTIPKVDSEGNFIKR